MVLMDRSCIALLVTMVIRSAQCINDTTNVDTDVGTFTGTVEEVSVDNQTVHVTSFLGIPYAEAPIGNLRFAKSVLKELLNGTYNATFHRPMCPQEGSFSSTLDTSEDCLFLNIYVKSKSRSNLPVMIWLHGGSFHEGVFQHGGSNYYPGDILAAREDVIIVTINYRLAVLGFLSTGDDRLPGNYGLWDQHIAIQWVHRHIARFNGDPSRVTLFGQLTGAVCALYQGMYAGNKGLVHRIIAQSGSPITAGDGYTVPAVQRTSESDGLDSDDCLSMDNPVKCLLNMTLAQTNRYLRSMPTTPVYDGEFVRADPGMMLSHANPDYQEVRNFFQSLSLLVGYNDMDGLPYIKYRLAERFPDPGTHTHFAKSINTLFGDNIFAGTRYETSSIPEGLIDRIVNRYTDLNNPNDPNNIMNMLLQFGTDYTFRVPALRTVQTYKTLGGKQAYAYKFSGQPGFENGRSVTQSWAKEATNGDEIPFVFGFSPSVLNNLNVTDPYMPSVSELFLSRRMMSYWTNFAKTGSPDSGFSPDFSWPEFSSSGAFLQLSLQSANHSITDDNYGEPSASFWESLRPYFDKYKVGTNMPDGETKAPDKLQVICRGNYTGLRSNTLEIISLVLAPLVVLLLIILAIACVCCCRVKRDGIKYETVEMSGRY